MKGIRKEVQELKCNSLDTTLEENTRSGLNILYTGGYGRIKRKRRPQKRLEDDFKRHVQLKDNYSTG